MLHGSCCQLPDSFRSFVAGLCALGFCCSQSHPTDPQVAQGLLAELIAPTSGGPSSLRLCLLPPPHWRVPPSRCRRPRSLRRRRCTVRIRPATRTVVAPPPTTPDHHPEQTHAHHIARHRHDMTHTNRRHSHEVEGRVEQLQRMSQHHLSHSILRIRL